MSKLASRKLIMTVIGVAIVAISTFLGVELPAENAEALFGLVAAYVVGQGVVDAAATVAAGAQLGEAAKGVANAAAEVEEVAG
jgi:xanthosine utilization system XapX-like protein